MKYLIWFYFYYNSFFHLVISLDIYLHLDIFSEFINMLIGTFIGLFYSYSSNAYHIIWIIVISNWDRYSRISWYILMFYSAFRSVYKNNIIFKLYPCGGDLGRSTDINVDVNAKFLSSKSWATGCVIWLV
jgi:hypothetical protein